MTSAQTTEILRENMAFRERWLEQWLSKLLPPVCVRWARERKNLTAIARLMQRKNIRIVRTVGDTREVLMCGETPVATCDIRFHSNALDRL